MTSTPLLACLLALAATPALAQSSASTSSSTSGRPHPALPILRVPDALGTNIHFTTEKPGEARMIAAGGFRVIRMDFTWSGIEKQKGTYDFSAYDRLTATLEANGLKPYYILDYGNTLYSPSSTGHPATDEADTDAFREGFAKWAAASVARFKGRGIIWEVWNEPNHGGFWKPKPNPEAYARLALAASRAIRAVAPRECIIGPATSTIDMPFLEACFQAGLLEHWDAVSVHPYRQTVPETSNIEYRDLRRLIDRYKPRGKNIPILSGEWGYSAAWGGYDEDRQGKYLPRQWMTNLMNGVPVSIWYDWHDDGPDPKEPEHHFGTVAHKYFEGRATPYDPKPAYTAAQTLARQLDGYSFNKRLWTGRDDEWVMLFTRGDAVKIAAWTSEATSETKPRVSPRTLSLPASPGSFSVVDHLGAAKFDLKSDRDTLLFTVTDSVSYITPKAPNTAWMRAAKWATVPLEMWVAAPHTLAVRNVVGGSGILTGATPRTGGDLRSPVGPLLRDAEPMRTVVRQDGFAQVSEVVVANPLKLRAEAGEAPGSLRVRVQGASGEAESGQVRVTMPGQKATVIPYALRKGEKEALLNVPLAAKAEPNGVRVSIVATDAKGRPQVREKKLRLVALDSFAREGAAREYGVVSDGDAKVTSTQVLSSEEAPAPLGGQKARALKLSYSWGTGWKFTRLLPPASLKIEGRPSALQVWVHGDNSGNVLRLRLRDESGQTFQPNGDPGTINWSGWRLVTFPFDDPRAGHWGGANDGVMRGALSWDSVFLLDSASRAAQSGEIYLANPTLVYEE